MAGGFPVPIPRDTGYGWHVFSAKVVPAIIRSGDEMFSWGKDTNRLRRRRNHKWKLKGNQD